MANTPNLNLVKPGLDDDALVTDINNNMDKIDTGFGSLSGQMGNKANRNYVKWGTTVSCELAGNVGLLLVNHDLRVQIWLPGDGISIWTSYSDNGASKGILKSVSGNSITFSASSADGNTFTITKDGSTITVTKSSSGTMLLIG